MNAVRIGNYEVEHPTMINGGHAPRSAFIIPLPNARNQTSQFVTLYGGGRWAADYPEILTVKVREHLTRLSARIDP